VKRLELKANETGEFKDYGVACAGYICHANCPLDKFLDGYPMGKISFAVTPQDSYGDCAVALIWAEFYGLY
jgi:hypothetical protein